MSATLKVVDEQFGTGAPVRRPGINLRLASERVSAREIIRSRVSAEVDELKQGKERRAEAPACSYMIFAEPESGNSSLSFTAARPARHFDVEAEVERALSAFTRRRFIMLLDDRQIDDLDEPVGLRPESEIVFVHLVPLKGG